MEPHRFNGIKIDLDKLSLEELTNLQTYVGERVISAIQEHDVITDYIDPDNVIPLFTDIPEASG